MSKTQNLKRIAVYGLLVLTVSGCSLLGFGSGGHTRLPPQTKSPNNPCAYNKNSCMYNGNYETGERQYAEDEARRLNQAQLERLKRGY